MTRQFAACLTLVGCAFTLAAAPPQAQGPAVGATAPRLLALQPTQDGKIKVAVQRTEKRPVAIPPGGAAGGPPGPRETSVTTPAEIELASVKDLTVFNTKGAAVSKEDALKALAKGRVVVVSADGKPVDPAFMDLFKEGTLVLVSPELVIPASAPATGTTGSGPVGSIPAGIPPGRP